MGRAGGLLFVAGFALVGVTAPDALTLSVLFGLLSMAVRLPGGLIWLAMRNERTDLGDRWRGSDTEYS